jgi:hypothetical protein
LIPTVLLYSIAARLSIYIATFEPVYHVIRAHIRTLTRLRAASLNKKLRMKSAQFNDPAILPVRISQVNDNVLPSPAGAAKRRRGSEDTTGSCQSRASDQVSRSG